MIDSIPVSGHVDRKILDHQLFFTKYEARSNLTTEQTSQETRLMHTTDEASMGAVSPQQMRRLRDRGWEAKTETE